LLKELGKSERILERWEGICADCEGGERKRSNGIELNADGPIMDDDSRASPSTQKKAKGF